MSEKSILYTAGSIEPPMYHLLLEKGFEVKVEGDCWIAENEESKFIAEDVTQLAGLILLFESKGDNWEVSDEKIDEYLDKFC